MRASTVWTGVVTTASASEAPPTWPRIWSVRNSRQTPATMPSSASARILTSTSPGGDLRLRGDGDLLQQIELGQHLAGAERHARQRILALRPRQVGPLPPPAVGAPPQCTPAPAHAAPVPHGGRALG